MLAEETSFCCAVCLVFIRLAFSICMQSFCSHRSMGEVSAASGRAFIALLGFDEFSADTDFTLH